MKLILLSILSSFLVLSKLDLGQAQTIVLDPSAEKPEEELIIVLDPPTEDDLDSPTEAEKPEEELIIVLDPPTEEGGPTEEEFQEPPGPTFQCPYVNERYTECASSSCFEETCGELLAPTATFKPCSRDCRAGCQCRPGTYRTVDNKCVDELTCRMCGLNESWRGQGEVGMGDARCDILIVADGKDGSDTQEQPQQAMEQDPGCYCSPGFFRKRDGMCVDSLTCDSECGTNEVYTECTSSSCFEDTCMDVNTPRFDKEKKMCTKDCKVGCKCHAGFYRDSVTGNCVKGSDCPPEEYRYFNQTDEEYENNDGYAPSHANDGYEEETYEETKKTKKTKVGKKMKKSKAPKK